MKSNQASKHGFLFQKTISVSGLLIIVFFSLYSCAGGPTTTGTPTPSLAERIAKVEVPQFNEDSAFHFVEQQVAFGPRVPNSEAHIACAAYLKHTLGRFVHEVQVQQTRVRAYDGTILNIINIIGSFNPELRNRILLCAHWDTRPYADHDPDPANHYTPILGANDGGSGVGVLLEIARQIEMNPVSYGIDIIFFDAEDYGEHQSIEATTIDNWALGSQYWSRNPHKANYTARYGILLDMVGAYNAVFTMEGTSMHYAPDVMKKVWDIAHQIGYGPFFSYQRTSPIVDDHTFINRIIGIPTIDIIHSGTEMPHGFFNEWHTIEDDMDVICKKTLKAVGKTVLTVLYLENKVL